MKNEFKQIETIEQLKIKRLIEEQNKLNRPNRITAEELIQEVFNNTSNPSYWEATKGLKERSYYNYNQRMKGGKALRKWQV